MRTLANTLGRKTVWLYLALILIFALGSIRYAHKAAEERSAFNRWRSQLLELQAGVDISAAHNYPNPPVMAVLLEPLALLPSVVGALLWYAIKAGLTLLALHWVFQFVEASPRAISPDEPPVRPFPVWAKWVTALLCLKPVLDDLSHGNVNLLILFLVIATLAAYRHRRDLLAGVVLGLAVACKVTPLLLVAYLGWKRAWKSLAGFALGIALFLVPGIVPAVRLGADHNLRQLESWYGVMVRPYLVEGRVTGEHINQSLPGFLTRLLTPTPSFVNWVDDREVPLRYDNLADLSPEMVKWLVKVCLLVFGGLFVWLCRTPSEERQGWRAAAEMSIIVVGMLLFSERTWKHHAVTLMLPFAVFAYILATTRQRLGPAVVLGTALVLMLLPGLAGGKDRAESGVSPGIGKLALTYGSYTLAFLTLLAGLFAMLWADRRRHAAQENRKNPTEPPKENPEATPQSTALTRRAS